ncbi:MAG: DJ-1 family glyoxalase III [Candidatus Cryptobacteroides sp.]
MKGVYIFLAEGFEDIEALATCDALRRGGVDVQLVSVTGELPVCSSHGVLVLADMLLEDCDCSCEGIGEQDVMIFPGGMPGSKTLASDEKLMALMKEHYAQGGAVAAICAAPGLVLSQLDELQGHRLTCFEGFQTTFVEKGAEYVVLPAVRSGRIVSGRSAAYAVEFGLEVLKMIAGEQKAEQVHRAMHSIC